MTNVGHVPLRHDATWVLQSHYDLMSNADTNKHTHV